MAKIKNDPSRYLKRTHLRAAQAEEINKRAPVSRKRESEFMTAPIDANFYIDFRKLKPQQR